MTQQDQSGLTQTVPGGIWFDRNIRLIPPFVRNIRYCKHCACNRELDRKSHVHLCAEHELICVEFGGMSLEVNKQHFELRAGDCVFIPGGARHCFEALEDVPYRYLSLMFCGLLPESLCGCVNELDRKGVTLVKRMLRESAGLPPYQHDILRALLTEMMVGLLRRSAPAPRAMPPAPAYLREHHGEVVARVLSIINLHYGKHLTLNQICKAAGVSAPYLHVLLKRETGQSFMELLQQYRMNAAEQLLSDSKMTVAEVAAAVGYQSNTAFYKVFKRFVGMTPGAYARGIGDPVSRR